MARLESVVESLGMSAVQTTKALAATHMNIAACQKDHATLRDGAAKRYDCQRDLHMDWSCLWQSACL